jgi:hypothetical protein
VLDIWSRQTGPHVLSNECGHSGRRAVAVIVTGHARRRGRVLMVAFSSGGLVRMTPHVAQEGGVLPHCQRQHDRKESCSKHVMLATHKGKSCASQKWPDLRKY